MELKNIIEQIKKKRKKTGFYDIIDTKNHLCNSPFHNPPKHIYIPIGKGYRHECPVCGSITNIRSLNVTY